MDKLPVTKENLKPVLRNIARSQGVMSVFNAYMLLETVREYGLHADVITLKRTLETLRHEGFVINYRTKFGTFYRLNDTGCQNQNRGRKPWARRN